MVYKCIIADDREMDRLALLSFVRKVPFIHITGVYASAAEVLEHTNRAADIQVLFLDIDMPGMNGIEVRKQLSRVPACIFVTSHPEFALAGYEAEALDYLVKPVNAERFSSAMNRLERFLEIHTKAALLDYTLGEDTVFIRDGSRQIKLRLHEIIYLEALRDYTSIVTAEKKYCVLTTLGNLLKEKAFTAFVRIHRSYAVQKHFIQSLAPGELQVNNITLPIGRTYREQVQQLLR